MHGMEKLAGVGLIGIELEDALEGKFGFIGIAEIAGQAR